MDIAKWIKTQVQDTLRRPKRIFSLVSYRKIKKFIEFNSIVYKTTETWTTDPQCAGVQARKFKTYDDYVKLQASKINFINLENHEKRFRRELVGRLTKLASLKAGDNALCLGARLGAEVLAFRELGLFAAGIDLNPGLKNSYVMFGDFHNLEFGAGCVDVVFTNSLDHGLDLGKIMQEVFRVLKPDGVFIFEADPGTEEGTKTQSDLWATYAWKTVDDLVSKISQHNFLLVARNAFEYPRSGTQLVFKKALVQ